MQGVPLPVPTTIIHAVIRSGENLILEDPASSPRFSHDPYFAQNQSSSVLCMPLIHQGKISGVVYLEVNLPLDTFTPERLQHLKMIFGSGCDFHRESRSLRISGEETCPTG